jgi:hypothetical protein
MIKVTIQRIATQVVKKRDWVKLYDSDHTLMVSQKPKEHWEAPEKRIEQYGNRDIEKTESFESKVFEQTVDENLFDLTAVIKAVNGLK